MIAPSPLGIVSPQSSHRPPLLISTCFRSCFIADPTIPHSHLALPSASQDSVMLIGQSSDFGHRASARCRNIQMICFAKSLGLNSSPRNLCFKIGSFGHPGHRVYLLILIWHVRSLFGFRTSLHQSVSLFSSFCYTWSLLRYYFLFCSDILIPSVI